MEIYKWDNKDLIKRYINCLISLCKNKDNNKKEDLIIDKQYLEDILFFSVLNLPSFPSFQSYKKDLEFDRNFILYKTTEFQRNKISSYLKKSLDVPFLITDISYDYNSNNLFKDLDVFLEDINSELLNLLDNSIKGNKIKLKNNKYELNFSGTTYSLQDSNFFEICLNSSSNPFLVVIHELTHGKINDLTERKFDKQEKITLYREVASLLIEIYGNEFLRNNNLISFNEYVNNFNNFYLTPVYNEIEIIDTLFNITSNKDFKINIKNVKKYIDSKRKFDPDYNFSIKELTNMPLKHHLIYFYSAMIALTLYDKFKEDKKSALTAAFDIMKNVNDKNEEELFKYYDLDTEKALDNYIIKNNNLIKMRNN